VGVVPRLLTKLDPETAKLIEYVTIDSKGRAIPKLYSKLQANKELRAMLNIGAKQSAPDVTQLSDAELIAQSAQQAKERARASMPRPQLRRRGVRTRQYNHGRPYSHAAV
jgi:hypothetical protein